MTIAILSDIHGNVYALEEVLKDIRRRGIEVVLNLGDSFYSPLKPRETYEMIKENKLINICGNQDREILEASLEQLENNETLRYTYEALGEDVLYWIQDLKFEKLIGKDFYMVHGTYFNDSEYLLEDVSAEEIKLRNDEKIIELTDNIESTFIFCGHSHLPRVHQLNSGQVVINPGSVGLQAYKDEEPKLHKIENNTPDASYAILNIENNNYTVEHVRVAYNYEEAAVLAEKNGREDWAYALRTGKVL